MQIKNVNDMKYAMRRAQRDVSCVCKEPYMYIDGDDSFKFYIDYHWNHSINDDGYIATWSFIKSSDLIVELVENGEQSFDDVAIIALDHIVKSAGMEGHIADLNDKIAKLGSELDKAIKKHNAATEKCKEMAKEVEFWKRKTYEMDKKNCEFRSRNLELEKELENVLKKKSKEFVDLEICICDNMPYYSIHYKEDGCEHVGYSSYNIKYVSEWLKEFFID